MLDTLRGLETRVADGVLAAAILSIGNAKTRESSKYSDTAEAVIAEVRDRIDPRKTLSGQEIDDRVLSYLSDEVNSRLFVGQDAPTVEYRMGLEGKLPLGAYSITTYRGFKDFTRENEKFAISCVEKADLIEHLYIPDSAEVAQQYSFFAKRIRSKSNRTFQWVVIVTTRDGLDVVIREMWRLFPQTVVIESTDRPIGLLKQFLAVYGEPLVVRGVNIESAFVEKLLFDNTDTVVISQGPGGLVGVEARDYRVNVTTIIAGMNHVPRIALAYAVNFSKYLKDHILYA